MCLWFGANTYLYQKLGNFIDMSFKKKSAKYDYQEICHCDLGVNVRCRISLYFHYNLQWNWAFDLKKYPIDLL